MKKGLLVVFVLCLASFSLHAQGAYGKKKSRKELFGGARDYRDISKSGLQISFGPNYTFTKLKNTTVSTKDITGRPIDFTVDPSGRFGGFIDVGMAHYRLKPSKTLARLYKMRGEKGEIKWIGANLFHRIDWGLGFDYIGGKEQTTTNYYSPTNQLVSTVVGDGDFYNGYVYGRITADRFTKLNDNWHLETGLGFNFNYMVLKGNQNYTETVYAEQKFQKNFLTQLHAHIGFNYKIRRGDYLIFGFYLPAVGIYEANRLKPTIQWFSSNYYPAHLQVKWIHHFTKKSNGCNTGSDADKKRNQEYMQGQ